MKVIYQIRNIINDKIYIGSTNNLYRRWEEHIRLLNKNKHHSRRLQNSWNLYGEKKFKFEIIENLEDNENLIDKEQYWITKTNCFMDNFGYNIALFANCGVKGRHPSKTRLWTEKQKKELSIKQLGKKHPHKGRIMSNEFKESQRLKRSKKVECIKTGNIYTSRKECANKLGVDPKTVANYIKKNLFRYIIPSSNILN
jgi:group I intron endonuclease